MMTAKSEDFRQSLSKKSNEEIIQIATVLFSEKEEALIKLTEFQNASSEMAIPFQQMKEELQGVRAECKSLREQNQHLAGIKAIQSKELFGRGTEKSGDILNQAMKGGSIPSDPLSEDARGPQMKAASPVGRTSCFSNMQPGNGRKRPEKERRIGPGSLSAKCLIMLAIPWTENTAKATGASPSGANPLPWKWYAR